MTNMIFKVLLLAVVLLPIKAVGLFFLWNKVVAEAITWAGPITWAQSFIAILCFMALTFSLSFKE